MRNDLLTALVNGAILSVPMAATVWVVLRLCRNAVNAATRYAVWWVTLCGVIALPLLMLPPRAIPAERTVSTLPQVRHEGVEALSVLPLRVAVPAAPVRKASPMPPLTLDPGIWSARLAALWALLASFMMLRLLASYGALQNRKRKAMSAPVSVDAGFREVLALCGVRRKVRLAIVKADTSPMVVGPVDPCVLLSEALLQQLTPEELDQVCLHEAAHLARFDDLTLMLQRVIEAVFCIHPLVRWIARQLDLEREIACDDFVIGATGEPRSYASCLTRVAELIAGLGGSRMAAAIADETSNLERRIDMLLNKTRHRGTKLLAGRLLTIACVVMAAFGLSSRASPVLAFSETRRTVNTVQVKPQPDPAPPVQLAFQAPMQPQVVPIPKAEPTTIDVPFTVTDPLHRFVTGLDSDLFRVFEDGVEQKISSFSGDDRKIALCVVWDVEPTAAEQELEKAKLRLADLLRTYTPTYPDVRDLQKRIQLLEQKEGPSEAERAVWEAVWNSLAANDITLLRQPGASGLKAAAAQLANAPKDRRAIAIVSGTNTLDAGLIAAIKEVGLPVFVIAVGTPISAAETVASAVQESGGGYLTAPSASDVAAAAKRVAIELQNRYVLSYSPSNRVADGQFHHIAIQITPPRGLPELTLAYRAGYYAPRR